MNRKNLNLVIQAINCRVNFLTKKLNIKVKSKRNTKLLVKRNLVLNLILKLDLEN